MKPDEILRVETRDAARVDLQLYHGSADKPVVIGFPAMGTKAGYYRPLAARLRQQGWTAALADLRGHGSHSVRASRTVDFGYADMLQNDWPAIVEAVRSRFSDRPLYLLGHSLGGQLSALHLARHPAAADGLILVASCSVYYRGWAGLDAWKLLAQTQLVGLIARALGVFPGDKMGFAGREARTQMLDWSRQSRTGRYEPQGASENFEALLKEVSVPVLAVSVEGDTFAPPRAVELLCEKMPAAKLSRLHHPLLPEIAKAPHFAWARNPTWLVEQITQWQVASMVGR